MTSVDRSKRWVYIPADVIVITLPPAVSNEREERSVSR